MRYFTIKNHRVYLDDEDYERVKKHKWHIMFSQSKKPYVIGRPFGNKKILLHRFILGLIHWDKKLEVDHIDGNGLNNRKKNLRLVTHRINIYNSSLSKNNKLGVKGVILHQGKYRANTTINGKTKHIGMYKSIRMAAQARRAFIKNLLKNEYGY